METASGKSWSMTNATGEPCLSAFTVSLIALRLCTTWLPVAWRTTSFRPSPSLLGAVMCVASLAAPQPAIAASAGRSNQVPVPVTTFAAIATGGIAQFWDRDADAEYAKAGMEGFQQFLVQPEELEAILERLEQTRLRLYPQ